MKEKVSSSRDAVEVVYDRERWDLFSRLRQEANTIQEALDQESFVYGSLARGDVKSGSDIDIVILDQIPSYSVELGLEKAGVQVQAREILKANPNSVPKAHLHINDYTTITFPLAPMTGLEEDFYRFGGMLGAGRDDRVPGMDKRLLLIRPTAEGHKEEPVTGREAAVARELGVGVEIVHERVRVLTRRDRVGRTGVYLKRQLSDEESFEEVLKYLRDRDSVVRRHLKMRE